MKIQDFINKRNIFKVDTTYQRPNNVWSAQDNQCLIDTILRGEPMPLFFINKVYENGNEIWYIVDGQQRLNCIRMFYDNKFKLSSRFSEDRLEGKTFNGENALNEEDKQKFLEYNLNFHIMEDYDDNRVRLIFSRLQRGKPLNPGERLNAMPGAIVDSMRFLAQNHFIDKTLNIKNGRYEKYPDIARMMYFEIYGAKNCSPEDLYKFFDDYKNLSINDRKIKIVNENLNYLYKCFGVGKYPYFSKHAWIVAIYSMISELRKQYSMVDKEQYVKDFINRFYANVYNEDMRLSDIIYNKYYDNVRGGWSEKNLLLRKDCLKNKFIVKYNLNELDDKRQISDEEKMQVFVNKPYCSRCGKKFDNFDEPEYHHIIRYADGGKTEINNIEIYCKKCHDIIHGKKIDEELLNSSDENEDF